MRSGYTHITLVADRSGSMAAVRSDAEGAVNQFVADQQKVEGDATLILVEFDADRGLDATELKATPWYHVVHNGDIGQCPAYTLNPRGNTALLDAVGTAITETGEFLSAIPEDDRPEHVVFVVQTDGQENSSRDWNLDRIREAIKRQTDEFNWQFVFLGMGPDTFAQGHQMGFANVTRSANAGDAYVGTYAVMDSAVTGLRTNKVDNLAATNVDVDEDGNVTPTT
jgi:hypothetical protein